MWQNFWDETATIELAYSFRPPFTHPMGMVSVAPQVAWVLPKHDRYAEAFAGYASVCMAKLPAREEILIENNPLVYKFLRTVQEVDWLDIAGLEVPETDMDTDKLLSLSGARFLAQFVANVVSGRYSRPDRPPDRARSTYRRHSPSIRVDLALRRLLWFKARLEYATVKRGDAWILTPDLVDEDTLVFADPPYGKVTSSEENLQYYGASNPELVVEFVEAVLKRKAKLAILLGPRHADSTWSVREMNRLMRKMGMKYAFPMRFRQGWSQILEERTRPMRILYTNFEPGQGEAMPKVLERRLTWRPRVIKL